MSRIGKKIIKIPAGVEVTLNGENFTVKGPVGTLSRNLKKVITINIEGDTITLAPVKETIANRALWGTYGSHITNMISGVKTPFSKKLILEGIGYKSEVKGANLVMALGFSHPVVVAIPESLKVTAEKNQITVSGIDKDAVGQFAANLRSLKKPEPYKGKGMRYDGEVIKRKQGKKTA
ncbi:MAG: 50S ribosomal protein L6 [Patescibacteria group bacterium]